MRALVYKSTGSWYVIKTEDGVWANARIKGKLKIAGLTSSNPIAVGDRVFLEPEPGSDNYVITGVEDRRNYINRQSPANKNQHHIIAANLDQTLLFATLKSPRTSTGFMDRFLVTAEAYHVPAIVVFNKLDLYEEHDREVLEAMHDCYESIGYRVMGISVATGEGLDEVKALLTDKTTLLSGHSGVGKSSFINAVFPEMTLRTQEVSDWSGKGLHTTTFAEMFDLPEGGVIIDTPGIRELGLVDISRQDLSHYFPEMRDRLNDCQFNNCLHVNEPGCAIKAAVVDGEIAEDRYVSYVNLLDGIQENRW